MFFTNIKFSCFSPTSRSRAEIHFLTLFLDIALNEWNGKHGNLANFSRKTFCPNVLYKSLGLLYWGEKYNSRLVYWVFLHLHSTLLTFLEWQRQAPHIFPIKITNSSPHIFLFQGENPIFKQATSTFKNPTYAGRWTVKTELVNLGRKKPMKCRVKNELWIPKRIQKTEQKRMKNHSNN